MKPFETQRLFVRNWRDEDLDAYAAIMSDARAMRYFPRMLDRFDSARRMARYRRCGCENGWTFAPAFLPSGEMVGFAGLLPVTHPQLPNYRSVEVGWTLGPQHWGHGYATELAQAWIACGLLSGHERIVAYTSVSNTPSQAVAKRSGMKAVGRFDHPQVDRDLPIRTHLLWEATRENWSPA